MRSFDSIFLFMNKKTVFLFIPFLLRTSCAKSEDVYSLSVGYIRSDRGLIRVNDSSTETLPPFNTSIEGRVYYYDGDYTKKQLYSLYNDFSYAFQYCHALSDRHYSYSQYDESGNFVRTIENVYSINQSYGTETPVKVDPFLYDLIKKMKRAANQELKLQPSQWDDDRLISLDNIKKLTDQYQNKQ